MLTQKDRRMAVEAAMERARANLLPRFDAAASSDVGDDEVPRHPGRRKRVRSGSLALREVRPPAQAVDRPFVELVRDVTRAVRPDRPDLRFQSGAVVTLHAAAQEYLVGLFEEGMVCATHAGRDHLTARDLRLAQIIRGGR